MAVPPHPVDEITDEMYANLSDVIHLATKKVVTLFPEELKEHATSSPGRMAIWHRIVDGYQRRSDLQNELVYLDASKKQLEATLEKVVETFGASDIDDDK